MVYQLHEDSIASKAAIAIGKQKNLPIIRISTNKLKKIKNGETVFAPSVEEFLSFIQNAAIVVTDSFHATAFSINLGIPFVSIQWKMFNDRIGTVLKIAGLEKRMTCSVEDALVLANEPIDFDDVWNRIDEKRKETWDFLKILERQKI